MNRIILIVLTLIVFGCQTSENLPNGLFPIKEYGKWGYINSKGEKLIKCQFDQALDFSEGFAPVKIDSLWGFIDTTGQIKIKPQFLSVKGFSDGLSLVTLKKDSTRQKMFIDYNGKVVFETNYEVRRDFYDGLALIWLNDEICFIDKTGKVAIQSSYSFGSNFSEGIAQLWSNDKTVYIDTGANVIFSYRGMGHNDFSDGYALIHYNSNHFYINSSGETAIELPASDKMQYGDFSEGLAEIFDFADTRKFGFIDTNGKVVIPLKFDEVNEFNKGFAAFRDSSNLWGFINKKGEVTIKPQFESVNYDGFKNGLCKVKTGSQWGYINYKGEFVWKSQKDIHYKNIDLTRWKLDTLEFFKPMYGGKYAGYDNVPRVIDFRSKKAIFLKVDTSDITVFSDKYYGYKIYLINGTNDTIYIPAQDEEIKLVQQAKNNQNKWQDIGNFINSFCGNSYHNIQILPNHFQVYPTPITKGSYKTKLRFQLELNDTTIFSNEYTGTINKEQFLNPDDKDKTEIIIWTN